MKRLLARAADYRALARGPYGLRPILVLTAVGVCAAFDGAVFIPVLPALVLDLDITPARILSALNVVSFLLIGPSLLLAYALDRVRRRAPYVGAGAIANGLFSLLTARSGTVGQVAATRAADAIGGRVGSLPVFSLVADYYPPDVRGKAFAFSGVIADFAAVAAPLAVGLLVTATTTDPRHPNWQLPYLISGPVLIAAGIAALLLLREPVRGYMERRAMGVDEDAARRPEEPPSFGEAWRTVWSVRVVRRLFIADIPQAVGGRVFTLVFPLFLAERYGLDTLGIAKLATVVGAFGLVGGFLAGGLVDVLTAHRPQRVLVLAGLLGVASSLAWLVFAAGPPLWVVYAGGALFGIAGALLGPARGVVYAQIVPANTRTLGLAVRGLAGVPAAIVFQFTVIQVVERSGLQAALYLAVPFFLLGALVDLSAAGWFERDMRAAMASQVASERWRRSPGALLVCRDLEVTYDGVQVLFGVDLEIASGEVVALLGTNGAGKSTLLRAIAGSHPASSGAIVFDGRDITHMPPSEIAARGIVLMPGGRGVFPGLSVRENLGLGAWLGVEDPLDDFGELRDRLDAPAGALSGGEQQMLALAQALRGRPRLLLIDELSPGLVPAVVARLVEAVRTVAARGTTVVLVDQSADVALQLAGRAVFMERGEILFDGPAHELRTRTDLLRPVHARGGGGATRVAPGARPILEVDGVSRRFGGIEALGDVSFALRDGEILGVVGPNGAGKTTLFDVISGELPPDAGRILLDGTDLTAAGAHARAARGLVRRFQDARLAPLLTVTENVLLALDRSIDPRNAASVAASTPRARLAERRARDRAGAIIASLGLDGYRDARVADLSTGLRRVVDLACVTASEPLVLLLDEPSTGIARTEVAGLASLIRRVRDACACSVLIVEHDPDLLARVCDEVIVMERGRIVRRGAPGEILATAGAV